MRYRSLGKTGLSVSELGMGCEGFADKSAGEVQTFVKQMEEHGINCIDLYSPNPSLRNHLGKALAGRRDRFLLQAHLCTVWQDGQYKRTRDIQEVVPGFEGLFFSLQTDYIDIGMIHYVDAPEDWRQVANGPIMDYAKQLQAQGKIRCVGLSSHNPLAALEAVNSGLIDVLMFSINPCYDLMPPSEDCEVLFTPNSYQHPLRNMDPARKELYEACERLGVGITVMKAFGGGDLLHETLSPAGKSLTPVQCIHYALTRPAVATVFCGAHTPEELTDCLSYETATEEEKDYAAALSGFPTMQWQGHCMYCGHCAPCPKGIDVASVLKFYHLAKAQRTIPETVREHYALLSNKADACSRCGACEARCPFGVPVISAMEQAAVLFSTKA